MPDMLTSLRSALADRYRIERELGEGGMATVYLAEDLKHGRKVAIKVLRPELAAVIGAERFVREIRTIAALQHPHILGLIDSGEINGTAYYVMPFVEGESLRDRLSREKQLPVTEAVRIATEVASALDYAHRHGVIHRDIKPENVLLHDGSALVADFGIALAVSTAGGGTRMTETGMSLGTPHYMSPEQAMGEREITARSDVYALGAMTYEMLVGDPPFTGSTAQAIVAKVVTETPRPMLPQRHTIPPHVDAAVLTALEKLPADRYGSAAEFAAALANPATTTMHTRAFPVGRRRRREWIAAAAIVLLALAAGLMLGRRRAVAGSIGPAQVVQASLALGDSTIIRAISNVRLAISPDGRRIAFVGGAGGEDALFIRELDQPAAHMLPDTRGAFAPFFSPDGASVGFFTAAGGRTNLKIIAISGGVTRTVADSVAPYGGASWGDDGKIYFTDLGRGLSRISDVGGAATRIAGPDSSRVIQELDFPDVLPGSRYAVGMLWRGSPGANHVGLINLASGVITDLAEGSYARYAAPGFLVIGTSDGRLLAAPLDARHGKLGAPPVAVLSLVQAEGANGTVPFAVSATGTLVYQPVAGDRAGLVWVDRTGGRTKVDSTLTGLLPVAALSPDGRQIAVSRSAGGDNQVWVMQLATGALSRLSFDVTNAARPVWTPDGRQVAFLATRDSRHTAWIRRADGSDNMRPASPDSVPLDEIGFDPQGRYTLYRTEGGGPGTRHLLVSRNGVDTVPRILVQSSFDHYGMQISPDGKWLAYVSEESGIPEVQVRPFPTVDSARFVVSVGGGSEPLWGPDGTELFFRSQRSDMMVAPVTTGKQFSHGTPRRFFDGTGLAVDPYHRSYDITADGKRFLMVTSGGEDAPSVNVIFNWVHELQALKAASR